MHINLSIGDRYIEINVERKEYEDTHTWHEILDELVWPALRACGYIIDFEFTDKIEDLHQEYLDSKRQKVKEPEDIEE